MCGGCRLVQLLFVFLVSSSAWATPAGLTFQGRLVKNGVAVEDLVDVTIKITSIAVPTVRPECVLYEETHHLNMAGSDGILALKIGSGTRTANDKGLSLFQVFSNTGAAIAGLSCSGAPAATSYTSLSTDSRNVYVSFVDGTDTIAFSSPYVIQSVPYAIEAERLAGKASSDYLQVTTDTTQTKLNDLMVPAKYTELMDLINGSSSQYLTSSASGFTPTSAVNFNGQNITNATGVSLSGATNRSIAMARQTTANTAGNQLTIAASDAASGATDKAGGNLVLSSGAATGSGSSKIEFKTSGGGGAGTADSAPTTKLTILGNGNVGIGTSAPTSYLHLSGPNAGGKSFLQIDAGGFSIFQVDQWGNTYLGDASYVGWDSTHSHAAISSDWDDLYITTNGTLNGANKNIILYPHGTGKIGIGKTTPAVSLDISAKTDSVRLPSGTTAQRPGAPANGDFRYNTDNNMLEAYVNGSWANVGVAGSYVSKTGDTMSGDLSLSRTDANARINVQNNSSASARFPGFTATNYIGATNGHSVMDVRGARGSSASPSALQNGDILGMVRAGGYAASQWFYDIAYMAFVSSGAWTDTSTPINIRFYTTPSGSTTAQERVRIASDGNVGIGTTSPQSLLHVHAASGDANTRYTNPSSGSASTDGFSVGMAAGATNGYLWNTETGAILFGTNDQERLRLDSAGNVGIGTTPSYKLHVLGSGGSTVAYFSDGAQSCSITPSTPGNISCSSDERLKKDITRVDDAFSLERILNLSTVTYRWRSGGEGSLTGYLAQEVEKIAPEMVTTGKDGYKQVSYVGFVPLITSAIKEVYRSLGERIETVETKLTVVLDGNSRLQAEVMKLKTENSFIRTENADLRGQLAELKKRFDTLEERLGSR